MLDKNTIMTALLNAFPSVESFHDFKEHDSDISRKAIPVIVQYAFDQHIIDAPTEASFVSFLKNAPRQEGKTLPPGLTFQDVIDKLAGHLSVNALIAKLEVTAKYMSLPEIQASMITRLKQKFIVNTPKKRALLRIIAYKLAMKYPDLGWDYEMLSKLPISSQDRFAAIQETAGVTVTFYLQGHGDIIFPPDVTWLRNELSNCIEYLRLESYLSKKVIETVGATAFNLRAPKKPGPVDEPRLYNESIRNAMAMAHQMAVRWLLSDLSTLNKKLIIVAHAGPFSEANPMIQRILEVPLTGESGVYLTDFAYLCARFASVKADFERYTQPMNPFPGHAGNLWQVNYFISYPYYDYIPCLLEEKMLPRSTKDSSYKEFKRALHFPEQALQTAFGAIRAMHRFPQSVLLLTEIAKVLRIRSMPFEADTVLTNLLLSHPVNLVARLMRMLIYANIAQSQIDFPSAQLAFERAFAESEFIVANSPQESDIWHEIGMLNFSRALKVLQYLRDKKTPGPKTVTLQDVLNDMDKARKAFLTSMTVSATGKALNSLYMFGYTLCLLNLLALEKKGKGPVIREVFKTVGLRVFRMIGWVQDDLPSSEHRLEKTYQDLLSTINLVIARYDNLVLCRSYIPHLRFMLALIIWDFAPVMTAQVCRITLEWLKLARQEAEKLVKDNVAVYHMVCGKISAERFIEHVNDTIGVILRYIREEDLQEGKDQGQDCSHFAHLSGVKLMLLELDRTQTQPVILCAGETQKAIRQKPAVR